MSFPSELLQLQKAERHIFNKGIVIISSIFSNVVFLTDQNQNKVDILKASFSI